MIETQKFIYEYRLEKQTTAEPKLIVDAIKVHVLPKTYRRVGRCTWNSSTRVWFKADEGVIVTGRLILPERDDAKALEVFMAKELENVELHKKYLKNATERYERIKALTGAVEGEEP